MPDFTQRSALSELLDRDDLPFEDIRINMRELDTINTRLGGHRVTLRGLQYLLHHHPAAGRNGHILHICEIGCGGGDNLRVVGNWCRRQGLAVQLTGIDINPHCTSYARSRPGQTAITFITANYNDVVFTKKPDVLFSSLFCHHFSDAELIRQLQWMQEHAGTGFFINDLHRYPLAYHSIRLLTRLFSRSRLVRHDAPVSVLRGFRRAEWEALLRAAGILQATLRWQWAFRWLLVVNTQTNNP
ncbi:MAG TPA: methyltransferase domain-containing protein [Lacibacter sp.]|nr:methyltransferase domain-containing protein [Lacibacter sp.]HMO87876.1 methyltransferase domain-containing protein [Lacibacter sp.]HMP88074.1 methyltransferase domain-containing protein [Lacibacter sp.]